MSQHDTSFLYQEYSYFIFAPLTSDSRPAELDIGYSVETIPHTSDLAIDKSAPLGEIFTVSGTSLKV
jgi:hypothetical protein